ncbi:MAG: hypothetical protein RL745_580, partial [Actinomycetota bacterium]
RSRCQRGDSIANLVAPAVADYIADHGVYAR